MRLITAFITHLIYANYLIAISAGILSAGWLKLIGNNNWLTYALFTYCGTMAVYNLNRYWKSIWVAHPTPLLEWVKKKQPYILTLIIAHGLTGSILLVSEVNINGPTIIWFVLPCLIAFLYSFPIKKWRIREIPFIKTIILSIVWVFVLVVLPALNDNFLHEDMPILIIAFLCFFMGIAIPFDIRDIGRDDYKMQTLPQLLGIPMAKVFAVCLLIVFTLIIANFNNYLRNNYDFYVIMLCLSTLILLTKSNRKEVYFALIDTSMAALGIYFFLNS
jgi:hypothetical protein